MVRTTLANHVGNQHCNVVSYLNKSHRLTHLEVIISRNKPHQRYRFRSRQHKALNWRHHIHTTIQLHKANPKRCSFSLKYFRPRGSLFPSSSRSKTITPSHCPSFLSTSRKSTPLIGVVRT